MTFILAKYLLSEKYEHKGRFLASHIISIFNFLYQIFLFKKNTIVKIICVEIDKIEKKVFLKQHLNSSSVILYSP